MRAAVWVGAVAVLATGGPAVGQEKKPDVLARLEGHRGGIPVMAFNPNPKPRAALFATGAGNGMIRLWDAHTGKFIGVLDAPKHNGARINNIGFSADGYLMSSSSKNAVVAWNFTPPPPPPKDIPDPKKDGEPKKDPEPKKGGEPADDGFPRRGAFIPIIFEDTLGADAVKIGTVTGDGRRVYYSATEGARVSVNSHVFDTRSGSDTGDELKSAFTPLAVSAIPDFESGLIAMYGTHKEAGKTEPAVAFVGLGDGKVLGRGVVRAPVAGRPVSIGFAPDGKWLVACNGEDLMYWKVPGSQVVTGDPKFLANSPAYVAAAGPNNRVAFASPPEDGKKVKVTVVDVSGTQPKVVAVYPTDIEKVSALAFSPDGAMLAVADDTEGVVQLWGLDKK
jgi:WD40 repeat protein